MSGAGQGATASRAADATDAADAVGAQADDADRSAVEDADVEAHPVHDASTPHHRRIRSFVTRAGRTSPAQQRARDTLGDRFVVPFGDRPLHYPTLFGREAPVVLEIGFGMGAATAEVAGQRRDVDFVGLEVHSPGVGALLKMIGEQALTNLRIVEHDAVDVVEQMIAPASLDGVLVWFPDPWHKARHNKRRLIQPGFVSVLASRLKAGGFLHCATDWEDYAVQMRDVLDADDSLTARGARQAAGPDGIDHPEPANPLFVRPVTKFEKRGKRLGHGVWDLVYTRI